MQKITPFLWFDDKAEEAMNFYVSIFRNSKPGNIYRSGDAGSGARSAASGGPAAPAAGRVMPGAAVVPGAAAAPVAARVASTAAAENRSTISLVARFSATCAPKVPS